MNRKEFIQRLGRISILVGMVSMLALFFGRKQVSGSARCGLKGGCKNCGKRQSCELPEAKRRSTESTGPDGRTESTESTESIGLDGRTESEESIGPDGREESTESTGTDGLTESRDEDLGNNGKG